MTTEATTTPHLPAAAIKVGGRRHSVSKPKHSTSTTAPAAVNEDDEAEPEGDGYPRPDPKAHAGHDHAEQHEYQEHVQQKQAKPHHVDSRRDPKNIIEDHSKNAKPGAAGYGAGGRIGQPAGKTLGA